MRLNKAQKIDPGQLGVDHVVHQLWLAILHDTAVCWQECTPHIVPCTTSLHLTHRLLRFQQVSMCPLLLLVSIVGERHPKDLMALHDSAIESSGSWQFTSGTDDIINLLCGPIHKMHCVTLDMLNARPC